MITLEQAYRQGRVDAINTINERRERFDAMTWDEEGMLEVNQAYGLGADSIFKGYVLSIYPQAQAVKRDYGDLWDLETHAGQDHNFDHAPSEWELWEKAALRIAGRGGKR